MAQKRLTITKGLYSVLELNNVAFRRDGRIEAQCKPYVGTALSPGDFATKKLENGMILAVDNVTRTVKLPSSSNLTMPLALNYTTEHMYDERHPELSYFALDGKDTFLPRLGYLAVGDKFTTNCVSYNSTVDTDWTDDDDFKDACKAAALATTPLYGAPSADGSILVSATAPTTFPLKLKVCAGTTMPDGTFGIKFQVYAC